MALPAYECVQWLFNPLAIHGITISNKCVSQKQVARQKNLLVAYWILILDTGKIFIGKRVCKWSNYSKAPCENYSFIGNAEFLTHKICQWECMTIPLKDLGNVDHHHTILRNPTHLG